MGVARQTHFKGKRWSGCTQIFEWILHIIIFYMYIYIIVNTDKHTSKVRGGLVVHTFLSGFYI